MFGNNSIILKYFKSAIHNLFRKIGYDIVYYSKPRRQSTNMNQLSYYETETGNYFLPTNAVNDIIANAIINNKIFEKEVVDIAKEYIKPGTCVLDVGSNYGQMAIQFAKLCGNKGKVYAFDVNDFLYDIIIKNIDANNLTQNIKPIHGAVHNVLNDELIFPIPDLNQQNHFKSYGSFGIDYNAKVGPKVRTITIDSLKIDEPISFMKIDIEGGDLYAMQGAINTIEKNKMPIIFEYDYFIEDVYGMCFQDYIDFVNSINYRFEKVRGHNYLIVSK